MGRVLTEIWAGTEGYVFLSAKSSTGKWRDFPLAWPARPASLNDLETGSDQDLYFCPLVFGKPQRKKEYAQPTHVLWADLDAARPQDCRLVPSIAWRTTQGGFCSRHVTSSGKVLENVEDEPHYQALWLLSLPTEFRVPTEDFITGPYRNQGKRVTMRGEVEITKRLMPAEEAAGLSRRIAYAEAGADRGGWDVTQVLRLPGTVNHKHTRYAEHEHPLINKRGVAGWDSGSNPAYAYEDWCETCKKWRYELPTIPQVVKLLWAKRLYYTPEQVRAAYPPVPPPPVTEGNGWPDLPGAEVEQALRALPMGVQMALERDTMLADRSLELVRMARELMRFGVKPEMAPLLLQRSTLNKFRGRSDEHERLLTAVADALVSPTL